MDEMTEAAVKAAMEAGASYADARFVQTFSETVRVKNGAPSGMTSSRSRGVGVRVIADGAWGFAATDSPEKPAVAETARRAVDLARAAATTITNAVELADIEPVVDEVPARVDRDPRGVPLDERLELLMQCDTRMRQAGVAVAEGYVSLLHEEQHFTGSEGASIYQERIETGGGLEATATSETDAQTRSYPSSHGGQMMARGWEVIEELDLPGHAAQVGEEAVRLLSAPQCPSGEMDLILTGGQLALQLHESCGHPVELDRVLGTEAAFAGMSFLTVDKLGSYRYGSDHVNITADATLPGGLGSFSYDDEGVPAQCVDIVRSGIFVGYLTSRETAAQMGLSAAGGAMRADGWGSLPLIRMTNINLLPGDQSLEQIIAATERGIMMGENSSWSIDDKRLNFQFGCELGWLIEDGEITGFVRNPTYTGITPRFWGSCDAVADETDWTIWGVPNCGKGEPMQIARVGHGVSAARFRGVTVGVLGNE